MGSSSHINLIRVTNINPNLCNHKKGIFLSVESGQIAHLFSILFYYSVYKPWFLISSYFSSLILVLLYIAVLFLKLIFPRIFLPEYFSLSVETHRKKSYTSAKSSVTLSSLFSEVGHFTLLFGHLIFFTCYKVLILYVWAPKHLTLFTVIYYVLNKYKFNLYILICYQTNELPSYCFPLWPKVSLIARGPWV